MCAPTAGLFAVRSVLLTELGSVGPLQRSKPVSETHNLTTMARAGNDVLGKSGSLSNAAKVECSMQSVLLLTERGSVGPLQRIKPVPVQLTI